MPLPELMVKPMREELTRLGFLELRTPEQVEDALTDASGTVLIAVNSVCGCAAGRMRPAMAAAIQHEQKPARLLTVFAGQDPDATARARSYFTGYGPSSPSVALLRDGTLVFMLERKDIEGRSPAAITHDLVRAFDQHCSG
ncbi:MAG: BrxA/BrxB family bacilliredoxin [Longimicrobiales bacterium]